MIHWFDPAALALSTQPYWNLHSDLRISCHRRDWLAGILPSLSRVSSGP